MSDYEYDDSDGGGGSDDGDGHDYSYSDDEACDGGRGGAAGPTMLKRKDSVLAHTHTPSRDNREHSRPVGYNSACYFKKYSRACVHAWPQTMIESFIKYDELCCRPRKQLKG